jgi:transcriptional regulator with XRE-family HTH domain
MAKKFSKLRAKMSPESQAKSDRLFREALAAMPLHELRKAQGLTQVQLAEALNVKQASISKIERQTDLYVSTLRRFINACGGELQITAVFPTGAVHIDQFSTDAGAPSDESMENAQG